MFKVFPVTITSNGQKLPLIQNWYSLATTDESIIQGWRNTFGERFTHYGVPTGSANDIVALDIDVKSCNGFEELQKSNLQLPVTMTQRTPSGGMHLIYQLPKDVTVGNTVSKYTKGVDTRGQNGYIVWYGTSDNAPISLCPDWFISHVKEEKKQTVRHDFIIAPGLAKEQLESLCADVDSAPPGESNNVLNACAFVAGRDLVGTGSLAKDYVAQQLLEAARRRGKPDREAQVTIESGLSGGMSQPPAIVCPFDTVAPPVNMMNTTMNGWCPPRPTLDMFFDFQHLRRPQNFKDWSPKDIVLFVADGGSGKTTLLLNEAICLALGIPFIGYECVERGNTLFITGEDSSEKIYASMGKIMTDMNLTREQMEIVASSIRVKKDIDMTIVTKGADGNLMPHYGAFEKVKQALDEIKPAAVIIDPIDMFWGSEAGLNDMSKAVSKFAILTRDHGDCQVTIVNHSGKQSSSEKDLTQFSGRGGSALPSHARVVRTMIKMKSEDYTEATGKILEPNQYGMKLLVSKFSDYSPILDKPQIITRTGHVVGRTDQLDKVDDEEDKVDPKTKVLNLLIDFTKRQNPLTEDAVAGLTDYSKAKVKNALNALLFKPPDGYIIKLVPNPDPLRRQQVYVVESKDGTEIR